MILVNGKADNRITVSDRGLQYGDGLFETIAYRNSLFEFLDAHLSRLSLGCQRLDIPFQQLSQLKSELKTVMTELANNDAVVKVIVTRGSGGRGYYADSTIQPTRIISTHSMPSYPDTNQQTGIKTIFCRQRLSENSSLAGLKHLNRLEQVLARNEWKDADIAEGLMFDQHEHIIEGTMSNVFIVKSGELVTSRLDKSGVAGIIRAEIIRIANQNNISVQETHISKEMVQKADEVFICNSIIGIWPVVSIIDKEMHYNYVVGERTQQFQDLIAR
jgi:4-amino-4-deoxychorismate lyase